MEDKLLILYTLQQLGPVTNLQLLQFMVDNQLMDYMTLQLALGDMLEAGQLEMIPHALGALYRLTPQGESALDLFVKRVPHSRRQAAAQAAQTWKGRFEMEKQVLADFKKREDGRYLLSLSLLEKDAPLLLIRLALPAWNMADCFARRWPSQAQAIYAHSIHCLSAGYHSGRRTLGGAAGFALTPQEGREPLLCLAWGPPQNPDFTLALPLPPDEDLACHFIARFHSQAQALCNFITAQLAKT